MYVILTIKKKKNHRKPVFFKSNNASTFRRMLRTLVLSRQMPAT